MRALALLALVAMTAEAATPPGRFQRTNRRCVGGRSDRGLPCDDYAFLEFAPASGAGMGAACACAAVTGAKGEALTFTRGSSATCTKTATGGLATSGIASGDLVTCSTNQPRVEYDSNGVLGLLVESAHTNVLLRSDALTNAAWADVGTPVATDGATDPFGGTTGDTLTDNDGAAFEGRSQAVAVTAATAYILSCYVRSTSGGKVRLSLDGTTSDTSGLSSTTWNLVTVADASSSGVSISAQVLVGNATGDTGDVIVGGCQMEAGTYATSYMATAAAAANRLADSASLSVSLSTASGFSLAASSTSPLGTNGSTWAIVASLYQDASNRTQLYRMFTNGVAADVLTGGGNNQVSAPPTIGPFVAGATARIGMAYSGAGASSTVSDYYEGTLIETSAAGATSAFTATSLFFPNLTSGVAVEALIISRVCVDPSPTRCR